MGVSTPEWRFDHSRGDDGGMLHFRIRQNTPGGFDFGAHRHFIEVVWTFDDVKRSTTPDSKQGAFIDLLEQKMLEALEPNRAAYLVMVFTGNGQRRWQWFAKESSRVQRKVYDTIQAIQGSATFPIDIIIQDDKQFSGYRKETSYDEVKVFHMEYLDWFVERATFTLTNVWEYNLSQEKAALASIEYRHPYFFITNRSGKEITLEQGIVEDLIDDKGVNRAVEKVADVMSALV